MLKWLKGFFAFWYDFIVGDDWTIAVGVIIALIISALLVHAGIPAFWLMPLAVVLLLGFSLRRATQT